MSPEIWEALDPVELKKILLIQFQDVFGHTISQNVGLRMYDQTARSVQSDHAATMYVQGSNRLLAPKRDN